jgi:asparagine synthase (glutamine-hydrolysing)
LILDFISIKFINFMCGITGILAFNEVGRFSLMNLPSATEALSKRGPDYSNNHYIGNLAGLGHTRLSIIDTSNSGNQPMFDESRRYCIVFNGEIYNFQKIKQNLENQGIVFHSSSDTEVLLQLYIQQKEACLAQLEGFFAFAIYDKEENRLFIARDRFGVKPLVYYIDEDRFVFGSEIKSLLQYGIEKQLDLSSLRQYLHLNYIPSPYTIFQNVSKLPAGHFMKIHRGNFTIEKYYEIPAEKNKDKEINEKINYETQKKQLYTLLENSVQKRLVADVPVGAFLSGGIDSSVVVALATKHLPKLHTFSVGYVDEPFFDETKYAQAVAKKFQTEHTIFSLQTSDLYEHLFDVLDYFDEPFADSSALPVFILSKLTKKHLKVVLSGDGADEVFGGYQKHLAEYKIRENGTAASFIKSLDYLWKSLPKSRNSFFSNKIRQFHKFCEGSQLSVKDRYWQWAGFTDDASTLAMLHPNLREKLSDQNPKSDFESRKNFILRHLQGNSVENLNEMLRTDMELVLNGDMLPKVDLMSMANGLEVREPFLDTELVEFAFNLPVSAKITGNMRKKILQDTFKPFLPEMLYNRPKKGFEVPLLKWFQTELKSLIVNDLLNDSFIEQQGIFDVKAIQNLKNQLFSSNPTDAVARVWALVVFQHWWKKYFS